VRALGFVNHANRGWNDGANESYAYTEIDRAAEVGADLPGKRWHP